ncbi:tetratricopeptide repeat protein [Pseudodesulfovibrio piezophilus]|uniref:Uncharacterized protein n=1 Tax=Pseudodesulfovibrio piezophilus (strain DSM 21447 / JCM 15486 / C1TLV30) TaxID=1322246 RepID=M1WNJ6_PSEP2|nr:tetratricopeptide repeat protein [Pseudodesulfovibrio piezophilus]CCH47629.1 conserved exported protein of unknown function [Pseudodesulfovibrio piezophilus C1TLV30]
MIKSYQYSSVAIAIFLLVLFTGCVSKTDVETLQIERRQDLNRIKQLEAELQESKQLLKEDIEKSQTPVRQKTADMWAEMQSLRSDIARIRGDLDTLNIRMDRQIGASDSSVSLTSLNKQLNEIEFILENQLQVDLSKVREERSTKLAPHVTEAEPQSSNATMQPQKSIHESQPPVQKEQEENDPAKALYDKAYALYKEGLFEKARSYWAEFTDTFQGHAFSASATFWQGQCYYKLKDYARAAILFEDVIEKHKKSSKYKSALLKAGYSWSYLGKPELAKMRMEEIIDKFPQSVEATQAKRFLDKTK